MRMNAAACSTHACIGSSDDGNLGNAGYGHQDLLDFRSTDVLTAADDDVRDSIRDGDVAVRVHDGDIAGVIPAIVVEDSRSQGRICVTEEAFRTPGKNLT